jgi:hypothetical protein
MEKQKQIIKSFNLDEETVQAMKILKENGIKMNFIVKKALKEAAQKIK